MFSKVSVAGTFARSCRRGCSTRGSTFPTLRSPLSSAELSENESTCSGSAGCSGQAWASVRLPTNSSPETPSKWGRLAGDVAVLVSDRLLNSDPAPRPIVPHFLDERDHPWLRCLIEEYERFIGRPQRDLDARLRQPLPCESPPEKLKLAIEALSRAQRGRRTVAVVPPKRARALVFAEAARASAAPEAALSTVADSLGVTIAALRGSLFADLPGERLVAAPARPISATELACRTNLALVQRLLLRATLLRIDVEGHTRALVRQAKWRGLIC